MNWTHDPTINEWTARAHDALLVVRVPLRTTTRYEALVIYATAPRVVGTFVKLEAAQIAAASHAKGMKRRRDADGALRRAEKAAGPHKPGCKP